MSQDAGSIGEFGENHLRDSIDSLLQAQTIDQPIAQSINIYIVPYVANESEANNCRD